MNEYRSYISKRIRSIYRKNMIVPVVFLCFAAFLYFYSDVRSFVFPEAYRADAPEEYSVVTFRDLRFTGYTESILGLTDGYYYYTVVGGELSLVLLSPETAGGGLPLLDETVIRCKRMPFGELQGDVVSLIAKDLGISEESSKMSFSSWFFNEPDYHYEVGVLLFILLILFSVYAVYELIKCIVIVRFPHMAPPIRMLKRYGDPKKLLRRAEVELLSLPQLATEDLFITEHFFIEVSARDVALVPIDEIVWVYKHSTLHKFLWYHFSITYTLSITANRHLYIQCPKNIKSDIDGIIDYLAEANHNILVGFSEENRLRVQEIQGTPMQLDKLVSFLNRRV